ncbi:TetR/AcrR family transcriptional regulator [Polaribacter sp. Q13]|uniref:TetR/AcrR family transcriptional regulator n=1 Tax=Polaribacter sp. Q13 TaxID=2806551 RepID=UPI00193B5511|nr:TetR/AcrR family transcriptional regulator [Polaribacter sp. Q13]QVY65531.1 TetR/AcrR family transcriptional regulator [Polaribacter sp. Q13]
MLQKLKSESTKQLILNESYKLFYKNGFKTTSIDKIMKETKLTKGAFYHHYKNKRELGLAVIKLKLQERVYDLMISPLYTSIDAIELLKLTFLDKIKSFSIEEKQQGCPMNNLINEIGDSEKVYQTALKSIMEEWKLAVVQLIERGKKEKTIQTSISSKSVAVYLISAFEGIRGIRKIYDNDEVVDQYRLGLSMYINQIKA